MSAARPLDTNTNQAANDCAEPERVNRFDSAGGRRSRGRSMLCEALREFTCVDVAAACGVHHSTISRLASGKLSTDSYSLRVSLQRHFGIPIASWDAFDECASMHRAGATF